MPREHLPTQAMLYDPQQSRALEVRSMQRDIAEEVKKSVLQAVVP